MKQIIQSFKTGITELLEVPSPKVTDGQVLIQTTRSLVSLGTERMLVEFGKASLIQKAIQKPEKLKMVFEKIKTEGVFETLEKVYHKLEQPLPLGYCNVGKVIAVGEGVVDFKVGDRVASNGQHAEFVSVPQNMAAHIPDSITDEAATFTVLGAIGLQGIRLINPTIGETIVVIGLGLIGLLSVEILIANGCKVICYDLDDKKVALAKEKGGIAFNPLKGNDPAKFVLEHTNNIGADGVLITAATKTNDIISQAAQMSRKRGRITLVGVIGLDISRAEFYEKEISFQVSCSYGPGRYDDAYEIKGIDYPLPFVRWTAKRNFETILQLIASGKLKVGNLISELLPLEDFNTIYGEIGSSKSIASILKYKVESTTKNTIIIHKKELQKNKGIIAIIGAGNFVKMTLLPILKGTDAQIKHLVSSGGINSTALAKKYKIAQSTTDYDLVLADKEVDLVVIATRHNLHASMVIKALEKGKHVFVEKPLTLNLKDLLAIENAYQKSKGTLMVGFNRRFSPHIQKIKALIGSAPMNIVATMNAGAIPPDVWVHDLQIGGGRIIGEACHYLDLMVYLTGSKIRAVCMNGLGINPSENTDNASILVKMENGSTGVVNYFANGAKSYSKERLEVFSQEKTCIMDNFRKTSGYGTKGFSTLRTRLDKGHKNQMQSMLSEIKKGSVALIPYEELINITKASLAAIKSLKQGAWIEVE
jgi:predicted dehydrogenase/threonine dehydrogenase-like Zn-dependent dehydrogenase